MTNQLCVTVISASLVMACAGAPSAQPALAQQQTTAGGSNTNPDAKQLADFLAKVEAYNKLRRDLSKDSVKLKETADGGAIGTAEKALAANIRVARASAKRGDIFTPATEAMFRRLLKPAVTGTADAADNKASIKEDAPAPKEILFKVNGEYPKEVALSTVPPDVLKALPPLPENLQFRFVGRHLILSCTAGNLIVDYMLNALP